MNKHIQKIGVLIFILFSTNVFSADVARKFVFPVGSKNTPPSSITQSFNTSRNGGGGIDNGWCMDASGSTETACRSAGGKWMYGHTGVDLGYACGSTVWATADGVATVIPGSTGYGNHIKIRHTMPNGKVIYSVYAHLADFSFTITDGAKVSAGQAIAQVGNTGLGASCHLHFAIYSEDIEMGRGFVTPTGYLYSDEGFLLNGVPIPSNTMKYFYDPLLFVDDRNSMSYLKLACCNQRQTITPATSLVTKTMYIRDSNSGVFLSLQKAVDAGWIASSIYFDPIGSYWNYNSAYKIEEFVLRGGHTYAFLALKSGLYLYYFKPGNHYLDARLRQDMMEYAASNPSFSGLNRETYGINTANTATSGRAWMSFDFWDNGWTATYVNVDHDRTDSLRRWVAYKDPATGSLVKWQAWY